MSSLEPADTVDREACTPEPQLVLLEENSVEASEVNSTVGELNQPTS